MRFAEKLKHHTISALLAGLVLCTGGVGSAQTPMEIENCDISFDPSVYNDETLSLDGTTVAYRAYRSRVYVEHPENAAYQSMNIFVPMAYFEGGSINGYTAATAPIFLPNGVGGYMPGEASEPKEKDRMTGEANAALTALSRGYVVAAPAIRGRTTTDEAGVFVGKAPALIVDYKAAVRYLRHNKHRLPAGDTEKIISDGTSAGGALSALLGATGNSEDYAPYLRQIGAAEERDDIFASAVYCPITNLEHADMAYEWIFNGINDYHQSTLPKPPTAASAIAPTEDATPATQNERPDNAPLDTKESVPMSEAAVSASAELKAMFPAYLNSLQLYDTEGHSLTLDENGMGSFREYIEDIYRASAQEAADSGEDLSEVPWLTLENGRVTDVDLAAYAVWATRMKAAPAFDKFDLSSGENDEFGTRENAPRHFTQFSQSHSEKGGAMADAEQIRLLNLLYYIGTKEVQTARHWRIRHGAKDRDTAMPVPAILSLKLQEAGCDVDFFSPWGQGHGGDYDLKQLFDWMDSICKVSATKAQ